MTGIPARMVVIAFLLTGVSVCTFALQQREAGKVPSHRGYHAQLDTHWEYLPDDPSRLHQMGGFARIGTARDQQRAAAPGAAFTVDVGDTP